MRHITHIFEHCSAGYGSPEALSNYWKNTNKWVYPGYHTYILQDGTKHRYANYPIVVNGVQGYNSNALHFCYQGGVDKSNYSKAVDTRTDNQIHAMHQEVRDMLRYLIKHQDIGHIKIIGHRDISPDKNLNGKVDPHERIKECPSRDVDGDYDYLIREVIEEHLGKH